MVEVDPDRLRQFARMRDVARDIFKSALSNASIESAFANNVHCQRRVLRIGEDLYDLDSYQRVFIISIGKAGQTMAASLEKQVGSRLEGIVASPIMSAGQASTSQ